MVESGGEWINGETGEIEPKVHLHWRLKKPAATPEELAALYEARSLATRLVGGDHTNISIVHPIRWPGSWHRKRTPKLARIVALAEDSEIDLGEAVVRLREAAGVVEPSRPTAASAASGSSLREASDHSAVASALAAIPNGTDPKAHDWEYWNKIGMTIWASTDGSEVGRVAFHEWSAKSPRYNVATTEARWQHYFRSPPTKLGFGSLVYRARQHEPGWRYENPASAAATAAVGELIAQMLRERDEADDNAGSSGTGGSSSDAGGAADAGASGGAARSTASTSPLIEARAFVLRDPKTLPKRQWVYGKHLIRKFGSATFAPSGSGKSNLLIVEALAMATGRALLGILPPQRARVWYWNGEDPYDELERRVGAACLHYGITRRGDRGLAVHQQRPRSAVQGRHRHPEPRRGDDRRSRGRCAGQDHPRQPDRRRHDRPVHLVAPGAGERQQRHRRRRQDMDHDRRRHLTRRIDLAHHTRKTGGAEVTVEDGRGAVALLNAVRPARVLNVMTEDEAIKGGVIDGRRRYFKVTDGKNNLALPADKLDWFRSQSIDLGNGDPDDPHDSGDNMGVVTAWEWPNALDGVTGADFDKVVAAIRAGKWRLNNQAKALGRARRGQGAGAGRRQAEGHRPGQSNRDGQYVDLQRRAGGGRVTGPGHAQAQGVRRGGGGRLRTASGGSRPARAAMRSTGGRS